MGGGSIRLDKLLSDTGFFSRSEAAALIKCGRVGVDGQIVRSGAEKYDTGTARITIDGKPLEYRKFRYIMMNKPSGYVSSTHDSHEKTVLELLDEKYCNLGLFPAGRLDKDAEGLLILTNDGNFAHSITSPRKKVNKQYFVKIDGSISDMDIAAFASGIILGDGTKCLPADLQTVPGGVSVTLREGKYHQIKRMLAATGKRVIYLKRVSIGGLRLDESLRPGGYRELTDEISLIFQDEIQ